jgi:hypothetical protein
MRGWARGGEGGLAAEPAGVRPGDQQLGGADGADAGIGEQGGHPGADQAAEILEAGFQGSVQACDLAGELAQGLAQVLFADRLARAGPQSQGSHTEDPARQQVDDLE